MTLKQTIKTTFSGIGTSILSTIGICVGGGACGIACIAPMASLFGVSVTSITVLTSTMLPLLTALSAIAFTIGFFNLYGRKQSTCCDESAHSDNQSRNNRFVKPIFWIGLLLTIGFYGSVIASNSNIDLNKAVNCDKKTSCSSMAPNNGNSKNQQEL